jgi:ActR/RegA family two-component response regulator
MTKLKSQRKRYGFSAFLSRIRHTLTEGGGVNTVPAMIARSLRELWNIPYSVWYAWDEMDNGFNLLTGPKSAPLKIKYELEPSSDLSAALARIRRTGQPIIFKEIPRYINLTFETRVTGAGLWPIMMDGEVQGVLGLGMNSENETWTRELSTAIQNLTLLLGMFQIATSEKSHAGMSFDEELMHDVNSIGESLEKIGKDYGQLITKINMRKAEEEKEVEKTPALFPEMDKKEQDYFILIMDNDPEFFPTAIEALTENGQVVYHAIKLTDTLTALENPGLPIVFVSQRVGLEDGFVLLREILMHRPESQVLFIADRISPEIVNKSMNDGAARLLTKPISHEMLRTIIEEILEEHSIK